MREEQNGTDSSEGNNHRWFYAKVDFNQWMAGRNHPSQGSHRRGSFVKEGGDWRCVSAKVPDPLLQNSSSILSIAILYVSRPPGMV